jgi:hypothetical protein
LQSVQVFSLGKLKLLKNLFDVAGSNPTWAKLLVIAVGSVLSLVTWELLGQFAVVYAASLAVVFVLTALNAKRLQNVKLSTVTKVVWFALSTLIFIIALNAYVRNPNVEVGLFLAIGMLYLTFPIGWLALFILIPVGMLFPNAPLILVNIILPWLLFVALGYLQWFVLLPMIWRKARRWRKLKA